MNKKYNEVRLRYGEPDDIAISDCDIHIERMDSKTWWIGIYKGNKRITFMLNSERRINALIQEDMLKLPQIEQETTT